MNVNTVIANTDWELLRRQKQVLDRLAHELKEDGDPRYEHLDGIMNYLDHIMDAAAEEFSEEVVFGQLTVEGDEDGGGGGERGGEGGGNQLAGPAPA